MNFKVSRRRVLEEFLLWFNKLKRVAKFKSAFRLRQILEKFSFSTEHDTNCKHKAMQLQIEIINC